jgi:hypothetical protein
VIDRSTRCIELAQKKQDFILKELKTVTRMKGVQFKRFEKLNRKLRHASIAVPAGKYLFGPLNRILAIKPKTVFWLRCPGAKAALTDWRQLLMETTREPTHVRELVLGPADWKGTFDASGESAGGVWLPGIRKITPVVWRLRWPPTIHNRLVTFDNPNRDITNSNLEMAAEVLGWLVLEGSINTRWAHVGGVQR